MSLNTFASVVLGGYTPKVRIVVRAYSTSEGHGNLVGLTPCLDAPEEILWWGNSLKEDIDSAVAEALRKIGAWSPGDLFPKQ
jgi:hypothetical protein